MEKVKVTKEVAEAIEFLKTGTCVIGPLCKFLDGELIPSHPIHRKIFTELTKDEAIEAIFFGYEVEKTPEQKLTEIYRYYRNDAYTPDMTSYADGIVRALDTLGIKIEGVTHK